MPGVWSLSTYMVLTACLAQAWAGPQYGNYGDGSGGNGGGHSGGHSGGYGGGYQGNDQSVGAVTLTETVTAVQAAAGPATVTVTLTAVPACNSVVTAYVGGCNGGSDSVSYPVATGSQPVPNGQAFILTTAAGALAPGISSIPAAQAVQTGVTVAGAAGSVPPAAASASSPASFFTQDGASTSEPIPNGAAPILTIASGAISPGISSIPAASAVQTGETVAAAASAAATSSTGYYAGTSSDNVETGVGSDNSASMSVSSSSADSSSLPPSPTTTSTTTSTTTTSSLAESGGATSAVVSGSSTIAATTTTSKSSLTTTTTGNPAAEQTYSNAGLLGIGKRWVVLSTARV